MCGGEGRGGGKEGKGEKENSSIITLEEDKQAEKQSKMDTSDGRGNIKAGSTHDKFTADMAEKTVINRLCKHIINTSTDNYLVLDAYRKTEDAIVTAEVTAEIEEKGNREIIDITHSEDAPEMPQIEAMDTNPVPQEAIWH